MFSVMARRIVQWGALVVLLVGVAAAQTPETGNPEDALKYKTMIEQARESGKIREMKLEECVDLALARNLTIEIIRYQPLMSQEQFHAALGVYDYELQANIGYTKSDTPVLDRLQRDYLGLDTSTYKGLTFGAKVSKYIQTGGSFSVESTNLRSTSNQASFNPIYDSAIKLSFTQPLWRDKSIDASRRAILVAKKDQRISELEFENQVCIIAKGVEDAYWNLVNAIEQQKIQIASRELSLIQLRDNRKRVEVGTLAPIIITQTMSQVAQAEQSVIASESTIVQAQNVLKNLICNDKGDPLWTSVIVPIQTPAVPQALPEMKELMDKALQQRPEVKKYQVSIERDEIDIKYFKNQTKPRLDFQASYSSNGTAGPTVVDYIYDDEGNIIGSEPSIFTGGMGTVYKQIIKQKYRDYNLGLSFVYTFGNRTAKANLALANLNKGKDEATLKQTIQIILVEVLNAVQTIEVGRKSLLAAVAARKYQEEQLDGQQKRYQAGLTTNFEVLQTQRDLTTAQGAELSALIELKKAFVELQRATFSILDQNRLDIIDRRPAKTP